MSTFDVKTTWAKGQMYVCADDLIQGFFESLSPILNEFAKELIRLQNKQREESKEK